MKECPITKKSTRVGGKYSNKTRATKYNPTGKVRRHSNLQRKTIYVQEIGKSVKINVSTKGLKTIKKNGAYKTLKDAKVI